MLDTSIQVKTEHFDGPLGLLLLLVQKEEMDATKLDLSKITQQYLAYLRQMHELNFDIAGDYLFMAAILLLLKSKKALDEDETARLREQTEAEMEFSIASEMELIRRLEELQHFQKLGRGLWQLPKRDSQIFVRPKVRRKILVDSILSPVELQKLTQAMMNLMFKQERSYTIVERDRFSIREKLCSLKGLLADNDQHDFNDLLELTKRKDTEVGNKVITFLSLLELARLGWVGLFQNEARKTIYIRVLKPLKHFDVEQTSDFFQVNQGQKDVETLTAPSLTG